MDERGWVGQILEKENGIMLVANENFEKLTAFDNKKEYECCTFIGCDFADENLSAIRFIECEFVDCNLSNAKLHESSILDAAFKNCKMIGIQFDESNHLLFSATFENCQLNHSVFYQMKLRQASFINCSLEGADFSSSDLQESKMTGCNLLNANFDRANLEGADLRMSEGLQIDPDITRMTKAKVTIAQLPGLLFKHSLKIEG